MTTADYPEPVITCTTTASGTVITGHAWTVGAYVLTRREGAGRVQWTVQTTVPAVPRVSEKPWTDGEDTAYEVNWSALGACDTTTAHAYADLIHAAAAAAFVFTDLRAGYEGE